MFRNEIDCDTKPEGLCNDNSENFDEEMHYQRLERDGINSPDLTKNGSVPSKELKCPHCGRIDQMEKSGFSEIGWFFLLYPAMHLLKLSYEVAAVFADDSAWDNIVTKVFFMLALGGFLMWVYRRDEIRVFRCNCGEKEFRWKFLRKTYG